MKAKLVAGIVVTLVLFSAVLVTAENNELLEGPKINIEREEKGEIFDTTINHDIDIRVGGEAPTDPVIAGPTASKIGQTCTYMVSSMDPQDDMVQYKIRFSDSPGIYYSEFVPSGQNVQITHTWDSFYQKSGPFQVIVKAIDENGHQSDETIFECDITIRLSDILRGMRTSNLFENILSNFPMLEGLL